MKDAIHDTLSGRTVAVGSTRGNYAAAAFDSNGNLMWIVELNPNAGGWQMAASVALMPDQSVAVAGVSGEDILIARIAHDGDTFWTRCIDQDGGYYGYDIATDVDGSIYVTAGAGIDNQHLRTLALTSDGDLKWQRDYGTGQSWSGAVIADRRGRVFVTGATPTTGQTFEDCVTLCYDTAGTLLWEREADGFNEYWYSGGVEVLVDDSGNVYTACHCNSSADSLDDYDYAIVTYKPDGELRWFQTYGIPGIGSEIATDMKLIGDETRVRLTGYAGTLTYDSLGNLLDVWSTDGVSMAIGSDGRVSFVDDGLRTMLVGPQGDSLWARQCGFAWSAAHVQFMSDGDIVTAGTVYNPDIGDFEWLIVRYHPCICGPQADLDSTGTVDAVDLALVIDIVFFGAPDVQDQECTTTRSDFNADGLVDAVDLAFLIDHVFYGAYGPANPCNG